MPFDPLTEAYLRRGKSYTAIIPARAPKVHMFIPENWPTEPMIPCAHDDMRHRYFIEHYNDKKGTKMFMGSYQGVYFVDTVADKKAYDAITCTGGLVDGDLYLFKLFGRSFCFPLNFSGHHNGQIAVHVFVKPDGTWEVMPEFSYHELGIRFKEGDTTGADGAKASVT